MVSLAGDSGDDFREPSSSTPNPSDDGYWQMMPDVVIEVASGTDAWSTVVAKIEKYVADGAGYALAIDPFSAKTFELGVRPDGLVIDVAAIVAA